MRTLILALLAALLAAGAVGTVHAQESPVLTYTEALIMDVAEGTTLEVGTLGGCKIHEKPPEVITLTEAGAVVAGWNDFRTFREAQYFKVRYRGAVIIYEEFDYPESWSNTYAITITFSLGEPTLTVIPGLVDWLWEQGRMGPLPGDPRIYQQHLITHPRLKGCHTFSYSQDVGLTCVQPGWSELLVVD